MKLGTLKSMSKRDGELVVVSRDNSMAAKVPEIAPNLREALENWRETSIKLEQAYSDLNSGKLQDTFRVNEAEFHSPLPRSFQWVDGSAFMEHVKLVRKSRNAEVPESLYSIPLMYQGMSDEFLAPREEIPQVDPGHGTDFEGEVAVITDYVPMGTKPDEALKYVRLLMLVNDVSLRGLTAQELAQGFGFLQSKPASAFAPFAVTPDELGLAWKNGRVHLPLQVSYNNKPFGKANAGAMHFHFGQLISHAAYTRNLTAGTIVGSGTVSNEDESVGASCIVEQRMREKLKSGDFKTSFMQVGDSVEIKMLNDRGENVFGTIHQKVVKAKKG